MTKEDDQVPANGNPARTRAMRGKRNVITHTLPPELLEKIDRRAGELGIPRAAFINMALSKALESGV
ncbi:CopG family transcriptional regulator [Xanthomonas arboricola pv. juglandis]|uniref:CopG family transcriptional regulator n=2 Tax=Xanthomonas TaxID=338 RepID=A0AAJ6H1T8_9XANT|nr:MULTISPECIES: CopG family transcriptional regulator [Xanthomonas]PPT73843.1 CopG family transcriptional regulator [Xanthomonas arboricola pv. populi]PPT95966.1 CopG family transcriptional regulator [Xanthomonas arboricola pv. juglandis]WIX08046.1 CopG family transcriptional regulator [Xanthomonas oryzae pv. oryzae]WIX25762.1 CopG family transcriptional regulator [Xanthomonas arboricola pv. corylina]